MGKFFFLFGVRLVADSSSNNGSIITATGQLCLLSFVEHVSGEGETYDVSWLVAFWYVCILVAWDRQRAENKLIPSQKSIGARWYSLVGFALQQQYNHRAATG